MAQSSRPGFQLPVGITLVVIGGSILLSAPESGRRHSQWLTEQAARVVSVPADTVDPANDGKLVHLTGTARPRPETLIDPDFGVSTEAFALVRSHATWWADEGRASWAGARYPVPSHIPDIPYYFPRPQVWKATEVRLGGFVLSEELVHHLLESLLGATSPLEDSWSHKKLTWEERICCLAFQQATAKLPVSTDLAPKFPTGDRGGWRVTADGSLYRGGGSLEQPALNDSRVTYRVLELEPTTVSVVAIQAGKELRPHHEEGKPPAVKHLALLAVGDHNSATLFETAQEANCRLTQTGWIVGLVVLTLGVFLLLWAIFKLLPARATPAAAATPPG